MSESSSYPGHHKHPTCKCCKKSRLPTNDSGPCWHKGSPTFLAAGLLNFDHDLLSTNAIGAGGFSFGLTFLNGSQWRAWNGAFAAAVLKGSQLFVAQFNAAGTAVTQQWTAITNQGRLRSAVQGPDGNLYIATDADPGQILKVVPS